MNRLIKDITLKELPSIDSIFATIIERYGIPEMQSRPEGFESLSRIILEQQVSLMSAQANYEKLCAKIDSFSPKEIMAISDDELRDTGVSRQKTSYIKGLSTSIFEGSIDMNKLSKASPSVAQETLITIKGIDPWTAQVYIVFCLQVADIFPQGDIALSNRVVELCGVQKTEVQTKSESWSPHRTSAALLLWHHYLSIRCRKAIT